MASTVTEMQYPKVVSHSEWLAARKELLAKEKELTRLRDRVNADRRRLPMVRIDKSYTFEGPAGRVGLPDVFEGRPQLVMHHFMWLFDIDAAGKRLGGADPGQCATGWGGRRSGGKHGRKQSCRDGKQEGGEGRWHLERQPLK